LIPVISKEPKDRAWLSSRIGVGCNIGKIMSSLVVPTVSTALLGIIGGVPAYTILAIIFCLVFVLTYYIHYFITKGNDTYESSTKAITFAEMGHSIFTNSQLLAVLAHDAIRQIAFIGIGSLTSYYCIVVLGDVSLASPLLIAYYLGAVIGGLIAPNVVKKIGSKYTNLLGVVGWGIIQILSLLLPTNLYIIGGILFIGQMFFGMSYGLSSGFYAMCGTYGEYKTGESANGLVMACCSLAIKIAVALRGVAITAFLGFIGYSATAEITAEIQESIRMLYGIFPVIFIVLSLIPLFFFKLDDKKIQEMEIEIAKRKEN
jgi:GPH family glycoside/pentoside/hexuronide:cation symporter